MPVLERSELQASSLSDLHAIAGQLGLDGFRRLRKADLIDAILGEPGGSQKPETSNGAREPDGDPLADDGEDSPQEGERSARPRRRRLVRSRRSSTAAKAEREKSSAGEQRERSAVEEDEEPGASEPSPAAEAPKATREASSGDAGRLAEGVVELLGNGSAFLRVTPPEPSDEDVYISAAQVRRCELVSGDRVSGPVRMPRRSERYPSLVRVDTINGTSADEVSGGTRYEDLPASFPSERIALGSEDPTLQAIEWLTPIGRGSRAVLVGPSRAGKSETLRNLLAAIAVQEDLQVTLVLAGVRPEEVGEWERGPVQPAAALSFSASADSQGHALERAVDEAKRVAARGGHAVVVIDGLDGMHPHAARKALAAARNLRDSGSLTVVATATEPIGGESTVIALDLALTSTGRQPILDLVGSGTLRPELLVGEEGAEAITRARASAMESAG
jgi:transcription termination factor Rho